MRFYQAVVLLLVAFAVLSGIQAYVNSVEAATVPEEWRQLWLGVQYVFNTSAATVLFTFLRNLLGYAENWLESKPEERRRIGYEARQLGATWVRYEFYLKSFSAGVMALSAGTPYEPYAVYIAGFIAVVVDLIRKAIKDLAV